MLASVENTDRYTLRFFGHGAKIGAGITSKKIPCHMCDSACLWHIAENTKMVWSYALHFWNFPQKIPSLG